MSTHHPSRFGLHPSLLSLHPASLPPPPPHSIALRLRRNCGLRASRLLPTRVSRFAACSPSQRLLGRHQAAGAGRARGRWSPRLSAPVKSRRRQIDAFPGAWRIGLGWAEARGASGAGRDGRDGAGRGRLDGAEARGASMALAAALSVEVYSVVNAQGGEWLGHRTARQRLGNGMALACHAWAMALACGAGGLAEYSTLCL